MVAVGSDNADDDGACMVESTSEKLDELLGSCIRRSGMTTFFVCINRSMDTFERLMSALTVSRTSFAILVVVNDGGISWKHHVSYRRCEPFFAPQSIELSSTLVPSQDHCSTERHLPDLILAIILAIILAYV
jgi:hypothetical protein